MKVLLLTGGIATASYEEYQKFLSRLSASQNHLVALNAITSLCFILQKNNVRHTYCFLLFLKSVCSTEHSNNNTPTMY